MLQAKGERDLKMAEDMLTREYIDLLKENNTQMVLQNAKTDMLVQQIERLTNSLSNGTMGCLKKKVDRLLYASIGLIVPLIWILINQLTSNV